MAFDRAMFFVGTGVKKADPGRNRSRLFALNSAREFYDAPLSPGRTGANLKLN